MYDTLNQGSKLNKWTWTFIKDLICNIIDLGRKNSPQKITCLLKSNRVLQATKIAIPPKHQRQVPNINKFKTNLFFMRMQNALRIGNINLKKKKKKSIKDDKRYTNPMRHISLKIGTSLGGVD